MIVGLERNGERILNPDSSMIIENEDVLWIAGERDLIRKFVNTKTANIGEELVSPSP